MRNYLECVCNVKCRVKLVVTRYLYRVKVIMVLEMQVFMWAGDDACRFFMRECVKVRVQC